MGIPSLTTIGMGILGLSGSLISATTTVSTVTNSTDILQTMSTWVNDHKLGLIMAGISCVGIVIGACCMYCGDKAQTRINKNHYQLQCQAAVESGDLGEKIRIEVAAPDPVT